MRKGINYCFLLLLVMSSCSRGDANLQPQEYLQYLEDGNSPFKRVVKSESTEYVIQLATPEYMACRQFSEILTSNNKPELMERINELKGHVFFIINMASGVKQKPTTVTEQMNANAGAESMALYYTDQAAGDITLVDAQGSLTPATYHFENNFSLTPYNTIVVGFEVDDIRSGYQLVFNDRYHQNPFVKADYSKDDLNQLPLLILN